MLELPSMFKIKELMTKGVFTLAPSCSLDSAAWALIRRGIGAAPVQDAAGRILGVVSKSDLLQPAAATDRRVVPPLVVEDVMSPSLIAVEEDGSVADAI